VEKEDKVDSQKFACEGNVAFNRAKNNARRKLVVGFFLEILYLSYKQNIHL
jgi:hypothetical protein